MYADTVLSGERTKVSVPPDFLFRFLKAVLLRIRLRRGISCCGFGLAAGSIVSGFLYFCWPFPLLVFVPFISAVFFFAAGFLYPVSPLKTSQFIDRKYHLSNRVETAFEINHHPEKYHLAFADAQRRDASDALYEALSHSAQSHQSPVFISLWALITGLCFYIIFAASLLLVPVHDGLDSQKRMAETPNAPPGVPARTANDVLQKAAETIEKAAEEYPGVLPIQELNSQIRHFPIPSEGESVSASQVLLRKWENEISKTIDHLNSSDFMRRRPSGSDAVLKTEDQESEACLALLQGVLENITLLRLDLADSASRSGGEGTRNPEKSKNSWGRGSPESAASFPSELPDVSQWTQKMPLPSLAAGEKLTADPTGNPATPEIGDSLRGFSENPDLPAYLAVPPLPKREIPADQKELIRSYFDY